MFANAMAMYKPMHPQWSSVIFILPGARNTMRDVAVVFTSPNNGPAAMWIAREIHHILGDRLSWLTSALVVPLARAAEQMSAVSLAVPMLAPSDWRVLIDPVSRMVSSGPGIYKNLDATMRIPKSNTNDIAVAIDAFTEHRRTNSLPMGKMAMLLTNYDEAMDNGCLDAYFHGWVTRVVVTESRTCAGTRGRWANVAVTFLPDELAQVKTLQFTDMVVDQHAISELADLIALNALRCIHPVYALMAPGPSVVRSLSAEGVMVDDII